jgi:hypothetical protein
LGVPLRIVLLVDADGVDPDQPLVRAAQTAQREVAAASDWEYVVLGADIDPLGSALVAVVICPRVGQGLVYRATWVIETSDYQVAVERGAKGGSAKYTEEAYAIRAFDLWVESLAIESLNLALNFSCFGGRLRSVSFSSLLEVVLSLRRSSRVL